MTRRACFAVVLAVELAVATTGCALRSTAPAAAPARLVLQPTVPDNAQICVPRTAEHLACVEVGDLRRALRQEPSLRATR